MHNFDLKPMALVCDMAKTTVLHCKDCTVENNGIRCFVVVEDNIGSVLLALLVETADRANLKGTRNAVDNKLLKGPSGVHESHSSQSRLERHGELGRREGSYYIDPSFNSTTRRMD